MRIGALPQSSEHLAALHDGLALDTNGCEPHTVPANEIQEPPSVERVAKKASNLLKQRLICALQLCWTMGYGMSPRTSSPLWRWVHNETLHVSLSCSRTELQSASRACPNPPCQSVYQRLAEMPRGCPPSPAEEVSIKEATSGTALPCLES